VQVEDHPVSYASFEGEIPARQYGAGKVIIWDRGTWQPIGNPRGAYRSGSLKFDLHGEKLHGQWALVRVKSSSDKKPSWLLIKHQDRFARAAADYSVVEELPDSVASGPGRQAPGAVASTKAARVRTVRATPSLPAGAVRAALPRKLSPQLATLVSALPPDPAAWSYEIKFDGYRLLVRVDGRRIRLMTRNSLDWSARFPRLAAELARLRLPAG
jgi:bifunctional non-homologous end joining protein LigD